MLEIIAWLGCAFLVLKGAEIFLSSLDDEFSHVRRISSLVIMVASVILAGLFAFQTMQEASKTSDIEESYKDVQDSVKKSFDSVSKELDATTNPVEPTPNEAVSDSFDDVGRAMDETPNAANKASGE
jgi:phage-related minor tail protein